MCSCHQRGCLHIYLQEVIKHRKQQNSLNIIMTVWTGIAQFVTNIIYIIVIKIFFGGDKFYQDLLAVFTISLNFNILPLFYIALADENFKSAFLRREYLNAIRLFITNIWILTWCCLLYSYTYWITFFIIDFKSWVSNTLSTGHIWLTRWVCINKNDKYVWNLTGCESFSRKLQKAVVFSPKFGPRSFIPLKVAFWSIRVGGDSWIKSISVMLNACPILSHKVGRGRVVSSQIYHRTASWNIIAPLTIITSHSETMNFIIAALTILEIFWFYLIII